MDEVCGAAPSLEKAREARRKFTIFQPRLDGDAPYAQYAVNMSDSAARIEADQPCVKCGYSLRTLRVDGVCPECGFPVAQSLMTVDDREVIRAEDQVLEKRDRYERWRVRFLVLAACAGAAIFMVPFIGQLLMRTFGESNLLAVVVAATGLVLFMLCGMMMLAWHGCRVRCHHVQYVLVARESGDRARMARDRRRDGRLARREEIYLRNIGAAKALFWLLFIAMVMVIGVGLAMGGFHFDLTTAGGVIWLALFALLVWINKGRLAHARSIRLHRRFERDRQRGFRYLADP